MVHGSAGKSKIWQPHLVKGMFPRHGRKTGGPGGQAKRPCDKKGEEEAEEAGLLWNHALSP